MPGGRIFKHKGPALGLSLECRRNREAVGVASAQSRAECSGNSCGEPQSRPPSRSPAPRETIVLASLTLVTRHLTSL